MTCLKWSSEDVGLIAEFLKLTLFFPGNTPLCTFERPIEHTPGTTMEIFGTFRWANAPLSRLTDPSGQGISFTNGRGVEERWPRNAGKSQVVKQVQNSPA